MLVADDADADDSSSLVTQITHWPSGSNGSVTGAVPISNFTSVTGTYGTLKVGADGSYICCRSNSFRAINASDTETDSFTYTVSDGTATSTATAVIITVTELMMALLELLSDYQEGGTLTVANSASANAGSSTGNHTGILQIRVLMPTRVQQQRTHIQHSGAGSATAVVTYNHGSTTSVNGTYGTLTIGSDGSYSYVANSNISDMMQEIQM